MKKLNTKIMAFASSSSAISSVANVFRDGSYTTMLQTVDQSSTSTIYPSPPPKPLLIALPCVAGEFPVLILLHGYLLYNSFYSQLMQHVASHGFIVLAPQVNISNPPFLFLHRLHSINLINLIMKSWYQAFLSFAVRSINEWDFWGNL